MSRWSTFAEVPVGLYVVRLGKYLDYVRGGPGDPPTITVFENRVTSVDYVLRH